MSEQTVWQALLTALTTAGLEYESIHRAVTVVLVSRKCGADSERLADVTLDRVAQKIRKGVVIQNISAYSKEIARKVALEYLRDRNRFMEATKELARHSPDVYEIGNGVDLRRKCQKACLMQLSDDDRRFLEGYYLTKKDREALAAELNLVIATLRTRIHRLRLRLRKCVVDCRRAA